MPIYHLDELKPELVTPKHSTAYGPLITGEQIEVGALTFKPGEGANEHSHPHEQIIVVLKGRMQFTIDGEVHVVTAGNVIHIPPDVRHATRALDATEVISCKGIVNGVGHRI
jgi:quercetin dioxygenase-like cupin family protein